MNLNIDAEKENTFDAIVVGTGISGGWAAKELTEKGLKTLVLERGRGVKHVVDYPTMTKDPWDFPNAGRLTPEDLKKIPVQSRTNWIGQDTKHWWVNDLENPYTEVKPFDWIRGYLRVGVRLCGANKPIGYRLWILKQMQKMALALIGQYVTVTWLNGMIMWKLLLA